MTFRMLARYLEILFINHHVQSNQHCLLLIKEKLILQDVRRCQSRNSRNRRSIGKPMHWADDVTTQHLLPTLRSVSLVRFGKNSPIFLRPHFQFSKNFWVGYPIIVIYWVQKMLTQIIWLTYLLSLMSFVSGQEGGREETPEPVLHETLSV